MAVVAIARLRCLPVRGRTSSWRWCARVQPLPARGGAARVWAPSAASMQMCFVASLPPQIRIRDPNQGGRDITEEIMAGGSGSRNSTPPVGHASSTPTPPQVGVTLSFSHFPCRRWRVDDSEALKASHVAPLRQEVAAASSGLHLVVFPSQILHFKPRRTSFNS